MMTGSGDGLKFVYAKHKNSKYIDYLIKTISLC